MTRFWKSTTLTLALFMVVEGSPGHPATMAHAQPEAPASAQSPQVDGSKEATGASRHWDGYDVGAAALNVVWVPFKAGVCGITGGVGILVFVASFGFTRDWSASALQEGCVNKWLIDGDDLRPSSPAINSAPAAGGRLSP